MVSCFHVWHSFVEVRGGLYLCEVSLEKKKKKLTESIEVVVFYLPVLTAKLGISE